MLGARLGALASSALRRHAAVARPNEDSVDMKSIHLASVGRAAVTQPPAAWQDGESGPLRFGSFTITETKAFPPAAGAQSWAYLTLNAEIALSLPGNPALQQLIASTRVRTSVDGQWLWWALRRKYPQRELNKLSGSDLIHQLGAYCSLHGRRMLLLGSTPRNNARAVMVLRQRNPGLDIAGYAPPRRAPEDLSERAMWEQSLRAIMSFRPDYVVLGLGAEKEQRFAVHMLPRIDGIVDGLFCFGGAIDLASGAVKRAPPLWQRSGLEGVYRVLQQPLRSGRLLKVMRALPLLALRRY